jgi:hypothetical protein
MTTSMRQLILRANAVYIGGAAITALLLWDVPGIFFGVGPQARLLANAPHTGIGFIEAHGLALILSVLLWRAAPERSWHLTALAVEVLLGTANLVFWQIFVAADVLAAGYITTSLHWIFAVLQLLASMPPRNVRRIGRDISRRGGVTRIDLLTSKGVNM